jgi:hypothetical protein
MAPLVGPTWPIFTTLLAGAAATGAGVAAGAAASSFLPQATNRLAAAKTVKALLTRNCIETPVFN